MIKELQDVKDGRKSEVWDLAANLIWRETTDQMFQVARDVHLEITDGVRTSVDLHLWARIVIPIKNGTEISDDVIYWHIQNQIFIQMKDQLEKK